MSLYLVSMNGNHSKDEVTKALESTFVKDKAVVFTELLGNDEQRTLFSIWGVPGVKRMFAESERRVDKYKECTDFDANAILVNAGEILHGECEEFESEKDMFSLDQCISIAMSLYFPTELG